MNLFENNIQRLYGDQGSRWLKNLPEKISTIAKQHHLSDLKPLTNLSYHHVFSGFQGSQPIILKLGMDKDSLKKELAALQAFSGFGVASVLAADTGWLLLQRAVPGFTLKTYFPAYDEEAVKVTCDIMRRLHQALVPHQAFPSIQDWLSVLDQEWDISPSDLQQARQLRDHLLATSAPVVLLHGDLHHENLLQHGDEWMVIDPKGVMGEPVFEVAAFLRNPMPELLLNSQAAAFIQHRIDLFASIMGWSPLRIIQWSFVQAVLCQAWALEDNLHQHLDYFRRLTTFFAGLL